MKSSTLCHVSETLAATALLGCLAMPACSTDESEPAHGSSPGWEATGATAGGAGDEFDSGDTGSGSSNGCVALSQAAELERQPLDIIMYVDTSGTMGPASASVEANINSNLAEVLEASNVDFRLIVLAGYGDGERLCVGPPLGGAPCEPSVPEVPANTSRFVLIPAGDCGSGAMFDNILTRATARVLPDERYPRYAVRLHELAGSSEEALATDRHALVEGPDAKPRDELGGRLACGGTGMAHDDDIDAALAGHQIARHDEAAWAGLA